jgi:hypothetical protein
MNGWIKFEKALSTDPRLLSMARRLGERDEAQGLPKQPFRRLWITCAGAVGILWMTADGHIDQDDTLALGAHEIDELTGIDGFCELMPREWLQVLDANRVKLPNFQAHNGTTSRSNAQAAARMRKKRLRDQRNGAQELVTPVT